MFDGYGKEVTIYPNPATDEVRISISYETKVIVADIYMEESSKRNQSVKAKTR